MALLERTCKTEQMNFQRLAARIFVALGGLLWAAAAFGASFSYQDESFTDADGPRSCRSASQSSRWP